jgi:acetyl-CoA carboxylase biotin carboxyl carrier protein
MKVSDHIAEIASWLSAAGIATFELTGPDCHICLRLSAGKPPAAPSSSCSGSDAMAAEHGPHDLIASPGVGHFLHAHPVHETPLVGQNEPVTTGQPLGLLQVGAILLPVVAPRDGIVASIVASDGSLVGYGDPLVALWSSP